MTRGFKLVFLALSVAACAWSQTIEPPLRVGLEIQSSPLSFIATDGRPTGYSVDLLDAITRETGLTFVFVLGTWEKIFEQFKAGEIDLLPSVSYTTERDTFADFSVPHLVLEGAVFQRRGRPPLTSTADLRTLRIAVKRGALSDEVVRNQHWSRELVQVDSMEAAMTAVEEGRCDATLAMRLVGNKMIRDPKFAHVQVSGLHIPELGYNQHFAVHAGQSDRLAVLNAGLARLHASGEYDRIYEKWIGPLEPRKLRYKDFQPYLLPGVFLLLVTLAVIGWQRRMLGRLHEQTIALRRSQDRLKLVLEGGGHALWDWDFSTGRIERDDYATSLTGHAKDEIGHRHEDWLKLIHPDDVAIINGLRERTATPGEDTFSAEYRIRTKEGRWRWIVSRGKILERKPDGTQLRAVGTHTDITPQKLAEEERAQLQQKMLEAQKLESLGVLAGGIAHDFNNLLAVILGNASLIRIVLPEGDPELAASIEHIELAAQRAANLCRQMLAYSGQSQLAREKLDFNSLITESTELVQLAVSKNTTLAFELAPQLPLVEGDRSQLQQLVFNLITNASEALGGSGGSVRVITGHGKLTPAQLADAVYVPNDTACDFVWIEVTDTGCGMSAETRAKIFEPFFTTKFAGRGLGLPAVLGIARAHRGVFIVRSEPGRGSAFRLCLPAVISAGAPASPSTPPPAKRGGTVLLADDEEPVRMMVGRILEKNGFSVVTARDGREAVEKFSAQPDEFTAVLLDLMMPVLDGAQVLREVRALRPRMHVVMMSGYGASDTLAQLRDTGHIGFLEKPFSNDQLLSALTKTPA